MELLEGIKTRRSIRKFTDRSISNTDINTIIEAGMFAPSAVNCQPWHFIVIHDRNTFAEIMQVHPYAQMLETAQAAILVCGDTHLQHDQGYWIMDCTASTQNILLAAHGLGIGSVWVGIHPRESRKSAMKKIFGLPDHVKPLALVALGYPAEKVPQPSDRYKPERIHYDKW